MPSPDIVSHAEWLIAHKALLEKEKALTRAHDALAAERRRQPWERVERRYVFENPAGQTDLEGLFEGRSQLIVYHHMLKQDDPSPCQGCCMFTDNVGNMVHLNQRDTTLAFVARAPVDQIEALKARMGWTLPFYSSRDSFGSDFGVEGGFGINVFLRRDGAIYHTYFTTGRGAETLGTAWTFLDLTPYGRQETWEVSPEGTPQTPPYQWWRRHDEYESVAGKAEHCCG
ncbi:DUF899 domain-containing protein [Rhizobium sp. KVB221]|uniref:DUF899 domain-containing protein n=1 Tax=Rhizobium setariae TaxID=2801340 RepID=A0A936YLI1_9HYPH|nr:DUF899 domain-containing protein [Rhizobium setariae]MBL0370937.1 DUF899 domain-containing protein [Rhizobium setariae]